MSEPAFEEIEVAVTGPRGELLLNRPEKLNSLRPRGLGELVEAASWFDALRDPEIR